VKRCSGGPLAPSSAPHRQPFLVIEPLRPLAVPHQPFLAPPVAEATPLGRQLPQASPQAVVGRLPGPITDRPAVDPAG